MRRPAGPIEREVAISLPWFAVVLVAFEATPYVVCGLASRMPTTGDLLTVSLAAVDLFVDVSLLSNLRHMSEVGGEAHAVLTAVLAALMLQETIGQVTHVLLSV